MNLFSRRAFKILMSTFLLYAVLVATHKGEFWPFSIYPMFSQAGNPWTRAIVRDVTDIPDSLMWKTQNLDNVSSSTVRLDNYGIEQVDLSNFISKTDNWGTERKGAIAKMFALSDTEPTGLMISKVEGCILKSDSVLIKVVPFLLIDNNTVRINPLLPDHSYTFCK